MRLCGPSLVRCRAAAARHIVMERKSRLIHHHERWALDIQQSHLFNSICSASRSQEWCWGLSSWQRSFISSSTRIRPDHWGSCERWYFGPTRKRISNLSLENLAKPGSSGYCDVPDELLKLERSSSRRRSSSLRNSLFSVKSEETQVHTDQDILIQRRQAVQAPCSNAYKLSFSEASLLGSNVSLSHVLERLIDRLFCHTPGPRNKVTRISS